MIRFEVDENRRGRRRRKTSSRRLDGVDPKRLILKLDSG